MIKLINWIIKKTILTWDVDYTKLTKSELKSFKEAKKDNYRITNEQLKKELGILNNTKEK